MFKNIHDMGVIHGDIRRQNVLVLDNKSVRIIDFDNASIIPKDDDSLTHREDDEVMSMLKMLKNDCGVSLPNGKSH